MRNCIPGCCEASSNENGPVLAIENLEVLIDGKSIIADISFDITARTLTCLLGPSGVGKSTLLKTLNRLIEEESHCQVRGSVKLRGTDIFSKSIDPNYLRRCIGLVFQRPTVFPISISRNVLFGAHHLNLVSKKNQGALLEKTLRQVFLWDEVKDRLNESAKVLSSGQQQRLAIARSLAVSPEILLLDEPTASLDERARDEIERLLIELKQKKTLLLVTHDPDQAQRVGDRTLLLQRDQGLGKMLSSS